MTLASLGSPDVPRLVCSLNSRYPLIAIGGSNILDSTSVEKLARELARTLSFMADRADIDSDGVGLLKGFYLYSLLCEIDFVHFYAHFVSKDTSDSSWTYHAIRVTSVTFEPGTRGLFLPYLLTWVQQHTIRMAEQLNTCLSKLSDKEMAECEQDYLRPLPMFERSKVSYSAISPHSRRAEWTVVPPFSASSNFESNSNLCRRRVANGLSLFTSL